MQNGTEPLPLGGTDGPGSVGGTPVLEPSLNTVTTEGSTILPETAVETSMEVPVISAPTAKTSASVSITSKESSATTSKLDEKRLNGPPKKSTDAMSDAAAKKSSKVSSKKASPKKKSAPSTSGKDIAEVMDKAEVTNATKTAAKTNTTKDDPKATRKSKKDDPNTNSKSSKKITASKSNEVPPPSSTVNNVASVASTVPPGVAEVRESPPKEVSVTPPVIVAENAKPKSTSQPVSPAKTADPSVPLVNLPVVHPIEKGTTLRMMRNRQRVPRTAQRAISTSNSVQNVLQQMVGGPQRTGVPCGRCDCCKSLLTYVTVLRNFMDHIVSGMAQGATVEEEAAKLPPPPCTLCEVQHVEHVDHTPKVTGQPNQDTPVMERPATLQQVQQVQQNGEAGQDQSPPTSTQLQQKSGYAPGQTHQFPHHNQNNWQQNQGGHPQSHGTGQPSSQGQYQSSSQGQSSTQQQHQQTQQSSQGQSWIQPRSQPQSSNVPQHAHQQGQQQGQHHQSSTSPQNQQQSQSTAPPVGTSTSNGTSSNESVEAVNSWSTFTDANAPKVPQQPQQRRPRRMENVAWGASQRQTSQVEDNNMNSEMPISETTQYPTGSPTKGHVEQYEESYFEDDYEDEEYDDIETNHAYVTLATDNETAMLCMVLGNSLLLSGTTKTLVVLVTEDVSPHMRYLLSTIYNNVENVDMMQSPGTTSLALLEQPDLGVSFTKLLIWGIENFDKGVFLDPNTIVVQNCDELFEREELSAVPDIGWPDCFNSDVFVYKPSMETFWSLLGCAEGQDSFDGGEQGVLNMYFRDWSRNISKKLPFLYNLMANVSYTYKPAFKQFGSQVKIVNFFGSYKPLNVQFHSSTGQMAPDSNVHPTYAQFVYYWLEIFTKRVLPLFSQEIHDFVNKQEYTSANDVLKFFPSNSRKRKESLPMPPSFRVYADANLDRPRRRSAVQMNPDDLVISDEQVGLATHDQIPQEEGVNPTTDKVEEAAPVVPLTIPGSEIGNYQDMSAWEHGRMDYLGTHSSDNIMARLSYFMNKPTAPKP